MTVFPLWGNILCEIHKMLLVGLITNAHLYFFYYLKQLLHCHNCSTSSTMESFFLSTFTLIIQDSLNNHTRGSYFLLMVICWTVEKEYSLSYQLWVCVPLCVCVWIHETSPTCGCLVSQTVGGLQSFTSGQLDVCMPPTHTHTDMHMLFCDVEADKQIHMLQRAKA